MLVRLNPAITIGGLVALLLTACETAPKGALAGMYQLPASDGTVVAQLKGSRTGSGIFDEDYRGYALLVDTQFIADAKAGWDKAIPLTPGEHVITAEYTHGSYQARAEIKFEAKAGVMYHLMIKQGTEGKNRQQFNDFWIVDQADGNLVTQVYHAMVSGGSTYSPFEVF